jgi:hypothetical protein
MSQEQAHCDEQDRDDRRKAKHHPDLERSTTATGNGQAHYSGKEGGSEDYRSRVEHATKGAGLERSSVPSTG